MSEDTRMIDETKLIPPGERRELRAVVRQQIKVLRAEVKQRKLELIAEGERRLVDKYSDEDQKTNDLYHELRELTRKANDDLAALMLKYEDDPAFSGGRWKGGYGTQFDVPRIARQTNDRKQLHDAFLAGIESQVQSAQLSLDRQEADLLRSLAMESLETEQAREFLARIPSVAELVPSRRLAEIERAFDDRKATR
jgi:hypothetical protein